MRAKGADVSGFKQGDRGEPAGKESSFSTKGEQMALCGESRRWDGMKHERKGRGDFKKGLARPYPDRHGFRLWDQTLWEKLLITEINISFQSKIWDPLLRLQQSPAFPILVKKCTTKTDLGSHFELIWIFSRNVERRQKGRVTFCIQNQNVSSVALFRDSAVNWPWSLKKREKKAITYMFNLKNWVRRIAKNTWLLRPVQWSQGDSVLSPRVSLCVGCLLPLCCNDRRNFVCSESDRNEIQRRGLELLILTRRHVT